MSHAFTGLLFGAFMITASTDVTAADSTSPKLPLRGPRSAPLYVIPLDSLPTLDASTPIEIVLRSGAKVLGHPLQPQPASSSEFLVRAAPVRMFQPRDTVRVPLENIEVAVSSVPLASGSPAYDGPRKLRPIPGPGESFEDQLRPAIAVLTLVAFGGAMLLMGIMGKQD